VKHFLRQKTLTQDKMLSWKSHPYPVFLLGLVEQQSLVHLARVLGEESLVRLGGIVRREVRGNQQVLGVVG